METPKIKPLKEMDNKELLSLVCQLHCRALNVHASKDLHDASVEAREELENRIDQLEQRNRELVEALSGLKRYYVDGGETGEYTNETEDPEGDYIRYDDLWLILSKHSAPCRAEGRGEWMK